MKARLLAPLAVLALTVIVAATPAVAAEPAQTTGQQTWGGSSDAGQWGGSNYGSGGGCVCPQGGFSAGTFFGGPGVPFGSAPSAGTAFSGGMPFGGFGFSGGSFGPWWAGMPLGAISAASGFTWPWAPWYWTPQWWTLAALAH